MSDLSVRTLALALSFCTLAGCGEADPDPADLGLAPLEAYATDQIITSHYEVTSTADSTTTLEAAVAAEALLRAYMAFFGESLQTEPPSGLRIRLYASRAEFLANNRSRPWAEAYYVDGVCHAYLDPGKSNPHHWLLHEAVHQLNRELSGYAKEKWINEGLATYFGSSRYEDGRLHLGIPDPTAYPPLWLDRWTVTGDWNADVQSQRVIPLRALITGQGGPSIDASVNAHYLGWWSLTHFLLHYDQGRYAAGYRQLIKQGGSLADFERHIGPLQRIEMEWYEYFVALAAAQPDSHVLVPPTRSPERR